MGAGIGSLVDRHGSRIILTALALLLGVIVVTLSGVESAAMLVVLLTLTRGFGQSALSVVRLHRGSRSRFLAGLSSRRS